VLAEKTTLNILYLHKIQLENPAIPSLASISSVPRTKLALYKVCQQITLVRSLHH
jgi:hypothetical protein